MLLIKVSDVETNPGPTTTRKQVWICDICHIAIQVRKQISIRCNRSNLVAVMDWGGANSRFLGLMSVWAARSFDQTELRPSVIKRIRQINVKYITHITSFGVTA